MYLINSPISHFWRTKKRRFFFFNFGDRDSAEASVDLAEASVSAESQFTPIRSFTTRGQFYYVNSKTLLILRVQLKGGYK